MEEEEEEKRVEVGHTELYLEIIKRGAEAELVVHKELVLRKTKKL